MELEQKFLAPYAMASAHSAGREHPEEPAKTRTPYQRDWHRITHSQAFRKLEFKTQVFVYGGGGEHRDVLRNRLTHTLEVSQIATSIGRALGLNEDLISAISLAHDLGHTPFGHAGEEALIELVASFNHNAHSLRIVRFLEKRYPQFDGLNLTLETLEGIEKHETDYDKVKYHEFFKGLMPTLEAQTASVADTIAYRAHDVEDGLLSGILTSEMFHRARISLWEKANEGLEDISDTRIRLAQLSRNLINEMIGDVISETGRLIAENGIDSVAKVREFPGILVNFSDNFKGMLKELGDFLMENFYESYKILGMTGKGKLIIKKIFYAYKENPKLLPPEIKARYDEAKDKNMEPTRVIADYIAGMTDRFAEEEYLRLFEVGHRA